MQTVSLKVDIKRLALIDQVAEEECGDRSQVLRWAVEAFLLHQKMTGNPLRPKTMKALLKIPACHDLAAADATNYSTSSGGQDTDQMGLIAETPHRAPSRVQAPQPQVRYTRGTTSTTKAK